MEDHDYAKVIIGEFPYEDPKPSRQVPGPTDPSHPPHLLTPVLQTIGTVPQICAQSAGKDSASGGESDHAAVTALLQQQLSVAQLLQIAQQHKLLLFNQPRSDQIDSQPDTKKLKDTEQTDTSNSTNNPSLTSQMPMALYSQPPAGIPLSHLIPIPANMAQQLIASGSVKLQGPSGPVTVQTLIAPPPEKMETEEKRGLEDSGKETGGSDGKSDRKRVSDQNDGIGHEWKPVSGRRSSRNAYRIPKRSSGNECKGPSDDKASTKLCCCRGCNQPAKPNEERGPDFCSNECVVKHCKMVFRGWVAQQSLKAT